MVTNGKNILTVLATGFIIFLGLSFPAAAQEYRATITGTITDPSGAPVPGAKIQITDVQRDLTYNTVSNSVGSYTSIPLLPGDYSIAVEANGFKKYVRSNILLNVSQQAAVNVTLEVGAVTQTINVTSRAPLLDTQTANRGAILPSQAIATIPNNGRDIYNLVFSMTGAYQPCTCLGQGVSITGVGHSTFGINGSASGTSGRSPNNGILLNGVSAQNGGNNATLQPTIYAVDQVQVKTSTYNAALGRTGGGYVAVNTKAGTNTLHGIVYENLNNSALSANSWDNNLNGQPISPYQISDYGFEVGGPVYIPKVYDGRNKLFFMVSWDHNPTSDVSPETGTVPTLDERNGNFSGLMNAQGQPITIYDPTTANASNGYTRTAFEGNIVSPINTVGQNIVNLYPKPTSDGNQYTHIDNLFVPSPETDNINQWIERLDFQLNNKNRFYAEFGRTTESIYSYGLFVNVPLISTGTSEPGENNSMQGVTDWTSTINPTTIFDLKVGYTRLEQTRGNPLSAGYDPTQLGFPSSLVSQFHALQFPTLSMGQYASMGTDAIGRGTLDQDVDIEMSLAKSLGKQLIHMGAQFIDYGQSNGSPNSQDGSYTFGKNWTQQNPLRGDSVSGNEIADLLLGYPSSGFVDNNAIPYFVSKDWAVYFQDNWKVTHRLTLDLGMRWDYDTPMTERFNRITNGFAFNQASPIAGAVAAAPGVANCPACANLMGGLLFAGNSGVSRYAWKPDKTDFEPRIGVAFEVNNKTVLRGGFGMYNLLTAMNEDPYQTGFSIQTPLVASLDGGLTPAVTLSNPFPTSIYPTGLLTPIGSSEGLATQLGQSISFQDPNFPSPTSYQWSMGFERLLPEKITVDAAYIGNKTTGYPVNVNLDFIPVQDMGNPVSYYTQEVTNPFASLLPGSSLNGSTVPLESLLTAYPQYTGVGEANVPIGWSRYDALQITGKRQFANGSFIMVGYTLSKNLQRMALLNAQDFNLTNPLQSTVDEELATFDVPQKLDIMGTYNLPFGRDEQFGRNMPVIADYAVGGWKVGWNIDMQSGFPVPYPNAAQTTPGSANLGSSGPQDRFEWFNTSLFPKTPQAPFTLRNFPTMFSNVRYMAFHDWDISLMKDFTIRERLKFRIRADALNAFNHPYFNQIESFDVSNPGFGVLSPSQRNNPRVITMEADIVF